MKFFGIIEIFLVLLLVTLLDIAKADCKYGGQVAKAGEEFQIKGECNLYSCNEDGGISAKTCPQVAAPDTCKHSPQDNSKPYPSCCESYDC